jgi:uncharacterized protein (UPF0335 family)
MGDRQAMQVDISTLRDLVFAAMRKSPLARQVKDVVLEADQDSEGDDFIRVILKVTSLDLAKDSDLEALIETVEQTVGDLDDRFPSVRFADAA